MMAILKMAGVLAPAVVLGLSTIGIGTAFAVYTEERSRIYKTYRETDEDFLRAQSYQMEILNNDLKNGIINDEEYNKKKEYLSSDDFTQSVIDLDTTLDDEIKSLKDSRNRFLIATGSMFGSLLVSGGIACAIYPDKVRELLVKHEIHKNAKKSIPQTPPPIIYDIDKEEPEKKKERKSLEDYREEVEEPSKK